MDVCAYPIVTVTVVLPFEV